MKYAGPLFGFLLIVLCAGCGQFDMPGSGPNRSALASETVKSYWNYIDHAKIQKAYNMMTSGNRAARRLSDYSQDIFNFLEGTGGITPEVGHAIVSDDRATVPITLVSPRTTAKLHAYQHLFWENGAWKISDQNGQLSHTK